jgi:hypothetical protein
MGTPPQIRDRGFFPPHAYPVGSAIRVVPFSTMLAFKNETTCLSGALWDFIEFFGDVCVFHQTKNNF